MSIKVGINGLGRIGRAIFRNNLEKNFLKLFVLMMQILTLIMLRIC